MNFDLENTVRQRKSVRAYESRPLAQADKEQLEACISELLEDEAPFPAQMNIRLLEAAPGTDTEKLGTYGVIRGAKSFLCVTVKNTENAMEAVGEYAFPLELLRLAPSAANRQPWRVVHKDDAFHFYREENPKSKYPYDLQRLDVGIGACHFHLAAEDRALSGQFAMLSETGVTPPPNMKYLFSWLAR